MALLPPTITEIAPNRGPAGAGTEVVITGENFVSGITVTIGEIAATPVTFITEITARTPGGASGAVDVGAITAGGTSEALISGFTYIASPLILTVFPPRIPSTGGTHLTITGENFAAPTGSGQVSLTVTIGGRTPADSPMSFRLS